MTYLNKVEREALASQLKKLSFNQAKAKVRGMDPKGRLVYLRNFQHTGMWETRYDLEGLGARVTLVETHDTHTLDDKLKADFNFVDARVEPLPDNRT
jgi:hypothetical protein